MIQITPGQLIVAPGSLGSSDIKARSQEGVRKTPSLNIKGVAARAAGNETFFTDFENYAEMKVFNLNGDEQTWGIHGEEGSRCAVINWNSELTMDDWIIMPGVTLEGGKAYEVSLDMWGKGDSYPEKLEVFLGNAQDPSAMTLEAIPLTTYGGTTAKKNNRTCSHSILRNILSRSAWVFRSGYVHFVYRQSFHWRAHLIRYARKGRVTLCHPERG